MKKPVGHYCRLCGSWRANEKFSGKGHVRHVCKDCAADKRAARRAKRKRAAGVRAERDVFPDAGNAHT